MQCKDREGRAEIRSTRVDLILVRVGARVNAHRTRTPPSTRAHTSVHPYAHTLVHSYANVRTSVTTFICIRHHTYTLQDHYLFWSFNKDNLGIHAANFFGHMVVIAKRPEKTDKNRWNPKRPKKVAESWYHQNQNPNPQRCLLQVFLYDHRFAIVVMPKKRWPNMSIIGWNL